MVQFYLLLTITLSHFYGHPTFTHYPIKLHIYIFVILLKQSCMTSFKIKYL